MYKNLPIDKVTGIEHQAVQRLADNAFIPFDPDNRDYVEYLAWLAEGNAPTPADPVQPDPNAG